MISAYFRRIFGVRTVGPHIVFNAAYWHASIARAYWADRRGDRARSRRGSCGRRCPARRRRRSTGTEFRPGTSWVSARSKPVSPACPWLSSSPGTSLGSMHRSRARVVMGISERQHRVHWRHSSAGFAGYAETAGLDIAGLDSDGRTCGQLGQRETVGWRRGVVVGGVRRMNEVNARRARLVPGWVTVFGRVYHLGM